jgi:hypothetical protein
MRFIITAIAATLLLGAAFAERRIAPIRPYGPVVVTFPDASDDAQLDAFRAELAKVARARVYAGLARLTVAQGFFWDRDFAKAFDTRKAGVDNLAAALRLEHEGGAGWVALARLAGETRMLELESRPGVVCAPAPARFDSIAFDRLIADTRTKADDWAYTREADVAVRAAPRTEAAALEILGQHFVRVLERSDDWTKVVAPGGTVDFVAPATLRRLEPARLCYGKDPTGRWQIAGFIGRGD